MNRPNLKRSLIAVGLLALIGSVGAQTYYTHELATRVADRTAPESKQEAIPDDNARWDPWPEVHKDMLRMQKEMEKLYDNAFHEFYAMRFSNPPESDSISLEEQGDNYVVKAQIPGAQKNDIAINLDGRLLSISAKTAASKESDDASGHPIQEERFASSFQEAFTLPGPVNASGMHSDYRDGVLTLTIPKATS